MTTTLTKASDSIEMNFITPKGNRLGDVVQTRGRERLIAAIFNHEGGEPYGVDERDGHKTFATIFAAQVLTEEGLSVLNTEEAEVTYAAMREIVYEVVPNGAQVLKFETLVGDYHISYTPATAGNAASVHYVHNGFTEGYKEIGDQIVDKARKGLRIDHDSFYENLRFAISLCVGRDRVAKSRGVAAASEEAASQ